LTKKLESRMFPRIVWDELPTGWRLGDRPDLQIAELLHCSEGTVSKERRRRLILNPERRDRKKPSSSCGKWPSDRELARQNTVAGNRRLQEVAFEQQGGSSYVSLLDAV
jgi:hypothetical protein